uniref:Uncharacterized protein n=1 Tax=Arion vulgaris TaxID=1028688 RepID=A0A0B7AQQ7_9EUPU
MKASNLIFNLSTNNLNGLKLYVVQAELDAEKQIKDCIKPSSHENLQYAYSLISAWGD